VVPAYDLKRRDVSSRRRQGLDDILTTLLLAPIVGALVGIALGGQAGGTPGAVVGLILGGLAALGALIPQVPKRPKSSRTIPQDVKIAVTLRDGGRCRICGSTKDLQYDHIIPYSKGGRSDDANNIQLLCGYHNRLKSDR
jgi:hypothetical protein